MPRIEILEILQEGLDTERLVGAGIDEPAPGNGSESYALTIAGWAVGRSSPVSAVEVLDRGELLARVPAELPRADVAAHLNGARGAETSGFRASVGLLAAPEEAELIVQAALDDGDRARIGEIRLRRAPLGLEPSTGPRPLLMTTLGRTGSTWLARLLGQHPEIVAYGPFRYEPRMASYWAEVLKVLARPSGSLQPLVGRDKVTFNWWIGDKEVGRARNVPEPELQQWLEGPNVETLALFCRGRIEAFYEQVARLHGKDETASYFVEKVLPSSLPNVMWQLFPDAREVFMVRDFRDRFCSVLAFNEKRGGRDFGARSVTTTAEHVARMRRDGHELLASWQSRRHQAHLLRYEDLIHRPNETLASLLEYLGVDASSVTIDAIVSGALAETPEMERHRTATDVGASVGRWQTELEPDLSKHCNEAFAELLDAFGYSDRPLHPPRELMFVGGGDFESVGEEFFGYFLEFAGLQPTENVLDVGCGIGRMAVPLTRYLRSPGGYEGFDIVADGIAWCTENITARHPNFRFRHADIQNSHYNPAGTLSARDYRFPYDDGSFDLVVLTSVFTHMLPEDVDRYANEITRVLRSGGRVLATFFLLNDESLRLQANGQSRFRFEHEIGCCRVTQPHVPEAVVAYEESYVLELFDRLGLDLEPPIHYGSWPGRERFVSGQDIVVIRKR